MHKVVSANAICVAISSYCNNIEDIVCELCARPNCKPAAMKSFKTICANEVRGFTTAVVNYNPLHEIRMGLIGRLKIMNYASVRFLVYFSYRQQKSMSRSMRHTKLFFMLERNHVLLS